MKNKILVVDDDSDLLEPISLILEDSGYSVESISNGEQIYLKLEQYKPDLILLDILMSGSDGRKICTEIKNNSSTKHIPVIMMSAHPSAVKDSVRCGADDFIAKPFETEDLISIVEKSLS